MTKKKETPFNNPFTGVKLKAPETAKVAAPPPPPPKAKSKPQPLDEESAMFLEAVGAVGPVRQVKERAGPPEPPSAAQLKRPNEEAESLARLAELVSDGGEFELSDSDDFVEGSVRGFDQGVIRKLRAGDFTTQATLDLHGLTREGAKPALEAFIQKSRIAGHRCVLVVTGRGLNSIDQIPVLKKGAQEWLTHGRVARQVLCFCSAKPKDGGTGALYVLLRR